MREKETEKSHRYNSETKPIHAQDLQLLRYGSWVWIIGMDHVPKGVWIAGMDHGVWIACGPGVWIGTLHFELQPYVYMCDCV